MMANLSIERCNRCNTCNKHASKGVRALHRSFVNVQQVQRMQSGSPCNVAPAAPTYLPVQQREGLPHKAVAPVARVAPENTGEAVITNPNKSTRVQDDGDEREIELPACLDFPVRYGMGAHIDDNGALTESFSAAVQSHGEALFWPWLESTTVLDARYMRVELVGMVDELASLECWPRALLDAVVTTAVRAPLSALLPDTQHFRERLKDARAEAATRAILNWTLRTEHSNNWGQE